MKPLVLSALLGALTVTAHAADCQSAKQKTILDTAVAAGSFKTLTAALGAAGLADTFKGQGHFTVFAPTDAAFAKLPKGTVENLLKPENRGQLQAILKFHVLSSEVGLSDALAAKQATTLQGEPVKIRFADGKVRVNDATLVTADIKTSNGVIHVIDSVLLPPAPKNNIPAVAKKAGQFKTLLAAVEAAGLTEALAGKGPLTVLAPTDAAFQALPKGTVASLLKPENRKKLQEILTLHVVSGKVSAGDALSAGTAKALSGGKLSFGIKNGTFQVNGATIVSTDIEADNGVIHVIDTVLLPTEKKPAKPSAMSPAQRIEMAISTGVPIFNGGDHGKCADIYAACVTALAADNRLDCSTRQTLTRLVQKAGHVSCDTSRAWMLRSGLDHAHSMVSR